PTRAFRHDLLPVAPEESLDDVPVARELCEQLLPGTCRVRRLILILGLLRKRDCGRGNNQGRGNPALHVTPILWGRIAQCASARLEITVSWYLDQCIVISW